MQLQIQKQVSDSNIKLNANPPLESDSLSAQPKITNLPVQSNNSYLVIPNLESTTTNAKSPSQENPSKLSAQK